MVRPGGSDGIFGVVEMVPGVTVLAMTPDQNVLLAREYKYAVERPTLECVSGAMDGEESPLDTARRELKEELGATSDSWTSLGVLDPFTTVIQCPNHMYLAENVQLDSTQQTDEGELIQIIEMSFKKALDTVLQNEITHGASVAAILKAKFFIHK